MTDGLSGNPSETYKESVLLRNSGVTILSVGINLKSHESMKEIAGMTSDPDEKNSISADGFDNLNTFTQQILDTSLNGMFQTCILGTNITKYNTNRNLLCIIDNRLNDIFNNAP